MKENKLALFEEKEKRRKWYNEDWYFSVEDVDQINDLIDIHINGQLELYESNIIEKDNYDILLSDLIDDQYWNFAYSKNITDLNKVWKNIPIRTGVR